MNTNWLYSSVSSSKRGNALFQRMLAAALLIALLAALLPLSSAYAAPAAGGKTTDFSYLEQQWSNQVSTVRMGTLFYAQARLFPADFKGDADAMARAYELLHKYGAALKDAEAIILEHAGFDETGDVIDELQADETVHALAEDLRIMRGSLEKLDEEGYDIHRMR